MKYSIQCYIKVDNNGVVNAVKQLIPAADDPRIWDVEYRSFDTTEGAFDIYWCNINFHIKDERDEVANAIKGLVGVINSCEEHSHITTYKCFHDENPPSPCEIEVMLRKEV